MNFKPIVTQLKSDATVPNHDEIFLKYSVTSAKTAKKNAVYGIKVESLLHCPGTVGNVGDDRLIDIETAPGISHSFDEVRLLAHKLADYSVTPTSLLYVVDDYIS